MSETPLTFPDAAKALPDLRVGWRRLRDICRAAGCAIDYGKGRARVLPSEARRAVLENRVPPARAKAGAVVRRRVVAGALHPDVRC